jgi:hypothetical protein
MHDENIEASILKWTVHVFHPWWDRIWSWTGYKNILLRTIVWFSTCFISIRISFVDVWNTTRTVELTYLL